MSSDRINDSGVRRPEACAEYYQQRKRLWQRPLSRKDALKGTLGVLAAGAVTPHMLLSSRVLDRLGSLRPNVAPADSILIVIQQGGGNDGLNTVVPYTSSQYYSSRPTIAVDAGSVLPIDSQTGLHPNLTGLKSLWDAGHMAVVQGVGYDGANMSHFESAVTWETGVVNAFSPTGWLARYLDSALAAVDNPLKALSIGYALPLAFKSAVSSTPSLSSLSDFQLYTDAGGDAHDQAINAFRQMNAAGDTNPTLAAIRRTQLTTIQATDQLQAIPTDYTPSVTYPNTDLAGQLELVAQLISAGLGTRVFWVEQDGYDDHSDEVAAHQALLAELDGAVSAFYADMQSKGWDNKILLMTWSEFGRRVEENDTHGTDHGTAAPMLLIGGGLNRGVYGDDPVLTTLDDNGNLLYGIDYRSVYKTIIQDWMGADPTQVVGSGYETIPFVA